MDRILDLRISKSTPYPYHMLSATCWNFTSFWSALRRTCLCCFSSCRSHFNVFTRWSRSTFTFSSSSPSCRFSVSASSRNVPNSLWSRSVSICFSFLTRLSSSKCLLRHCSQSAFCHASSERSLFIVHSFSSRTWANSFSKLLLKDEN